MDEKALSGHEIVGIMPQAVTACAVSGPAKWLFFYRRSAAATRESGNRWLKLVKCRPLLLKRIVPMATNRSQRLRKKLCVDEFQELGFELNLDFKEDLSEEAIDAFLEAFIKEAMEANGLGYVGGDDFGLVCLQKRGSVNEEQRAAVEAWLKNRSELTKYEVSPLLDVWYPEKPINAAK
jgi:uncharacterized protein YggL (DUF469 family)